MIVQLIIFHIGFIICGQLNAYANCFLDLLFNILKGHTDRKNCSSPVVEPGTFAGYAISDTQLGVRFTKPITDDYDYLLYHRLQSASGLIESRYWPTYGPVWSDVVENLQPGKDYVLAVSLTCSRNSSMKSKRVSSYKKTFDKRKIIFTSFIFSVSLINVRYSFSL